MTDQDRLLALEAENSQAIAELRDNGGTELKQGLAASIRMTLRSMNETRKALLARAEVADKRVTDLEAALRRRTAEIERELDFLWKHKRDVGTVEACSINLKAYVERLQALLHPEGSAAPEDE